MDEREMYNEILAEVRALVENNVSLVQKEKFFTKMWDALNVAGKSMAMAYICTSGPKVSFLAIYNAVMGTNVQLDEVEWHQEEV